MPDTTLTGKTFYDDAWTAWDSMIRYSPAPRLRRRRIMSRLRKLPSRSLLDVGCGNGQFLEEVSRAMPQMALAGADISGEALERSRRRLPNASFHTVDLGSGDWQERYDSVVCMEVVEHCKDSAAAVRQLADMTERWLFMTVPCGPLFEIDRRCGHTSHFSAADIRRLLEPTGLRVRKLERWGFPFFNAYKHVINLWPDKMCESFLSRATYDRKQRLISDLVYLSFLMCLPWWGYQLFVVAERPHGRCGPGAGLSSGGSQGSSA